MGAAIGRLTLAQLRETLTRHEVGFSPIYDIADVFDDPQFNARQAIVSVPDSELGSVQMQGVAPRFSETPGVVCRAGPTIAGLLLTPAALEIGLGGGGSTFLNRARVLYSSLLPGTAGDPLDGLFEWHPLLQVVPKAGSTDTYTPHIYRHNSVRLRGPEQTAQSLQGKTVIALFGGSSTYGLYLKEDENWPNKLEQTLQNIETISAINRQRGIRTLWVGQLLNRAVLTSGKPYGWLPLIADKDLWPLMAKLNGVLGATATKLGDPYIDVPIDDFTGADFFDQGHFTPSGAIKFAARIAPEVSANCR